MGLFKSFRNKNPAQTRFQMVTDNGNGFYSWDGNVYRSDIVRACIRPKVKAVGKLVAKHIRETIDSEGRKNITVNPDAYMRFLLEEPNPHMSGQKLQEKLAAQLCINQNAFALIIRDDNGYPIEIYPISSRYAEAIYDDAHNLYIRFTFKNMKTYTFPYTELIHLREDYNQNDIFGTSIAPALAPLMETVTTIDQGLVKAIKNSNVIRWLLKFVTSMRPEDLKKQAAEFTKNYLSIEGNDVGVAAVDSKADAIRVEPKDFVPNAAQMDRTTKRIYALFNTNENIVNSKWSEDEWNAYYEAEIEPIAIDLKNEYTRKLFSRRERGFGNYIMFEAMNLATSSTTTKLNFLQMVDRGAMLPNEWRSIFNLGPVPGGDEPIRRLDTRPVTEGGGKSEN